MTEAKGCFLLVGVGRPCVSLPTTDGGGEKNNMEKLRDRGMRHEGEGGRQRLTVIQQNSQREGSRKTAKWLDYLIRRWEFAVPQKYLQCSMGNGGKRLFQALLLFVMPASISGQREGFAEL